MAPPPAQANTRAQAKVAQAKQDLLPTPSEFRDLTGVDLVGTMFATESNSTLVPERLHHLGIAYAHGSPDCTTASTAYNTTIKLSATTQGSAQAYNNTSLIVSQYADQTRQDMIFGLRTQVEATCAASYTPSPATGGWNYRVVDGGKDDTFYGALASAGSCIIEAHAQTAEAAEKLASFAADKCRKL